MSSIDDLLFPAGEQDDFTRRMRDELGYVGARRLPDGTYVGLLRLMFTMAICVGVSEFTSYTRRYCFENTTVCLDQYRLMTSADDAVEGWIATRPKLAQDE